MMNLFNSLFHWRDSQSLYINKPGNTAYNYSTSTNNALGTSAHYWKQQSEVDQGQVTTNPNILAARLIKQHATSGLVITADHINSVLAQQGLSITQPELDLLLGLPSVEYSFSKEWGKITRKYPQRTPAGNGKWGIYMLFNMVTGKAYVGSTAGLHERIRHYRKKWSKPNLRPILQDIRTYGINNFNVKIFEYPVSLQELRQLIALEQYYILTLDPKNNGLLVANSNPGGPHLSERNSDLQSTPTYMYMADVLIYTFKSTAGKYSSVVSVLNMTPSTVQRSLNSGHAVYGTYTFYKDLLNTEDTPMFTTVSEVIAHVKHSFDTFRVQSGLNFGERAKTANVSTPAIKITRVDDGTWVKCNHVWAAREWTRINVGKTITTATVLRRVKSGIPLNGYRYELYPTDNN